MPEPAAMIMFRDSNGTDRVLQGPGVFVFPAIARLVIDRASILLIILRDHHRLTVEALRYGR